MPWNNNSLVRSLLSALVFGTLIGTRLSSAIAIDSEGGPSESESQLISESLAAQYAKLWESMSPAAKRGYQHLVSNAYLPHDFDEEIFRELESQSDPSPWKDRANLSSKKQRLFDRFGLAGRVEDANKPLQYVVTAQGDYVMNCFACHGGNLYGTTYPGTPNSMYALESLTESVRKIKLKQSKPMAHMDMGSLVMPLGTTVGTSNAVMFGVALMNYRDSELNIQINRQAPELTHHDMDAPPWWHFHRKHHIYIDGFAEKGHRGLMQFMLVRQNGPEKFRKWENDFRDVFAFLSELRPPKYPLKIDEALAERGHRVFESNCASCHGSYGREPHYPGLHVAIDDVGTDRVRFDALTPSHRAHYGQSWFADMGKQQTLSDVSGYVAPPLDGLWASAPYLHNGSVPTLWHLLHPDKRPVVWRRTYLAPDTERMGFHIEELNEVPGRLSPAEKRRYFDTRVSGKSASGHEYPNALSEEEKSELLEYLKTL